MGESSSKLGEEKQNPGNEQCFQDKWRWIQNFTKKRVSEGPERRRPRKKEITVILVCKKKTTSWAPGSGKKENRGAQRIQGEERGELEGTGAKKETHSKGKTIKTKTEAGEQGDLRERERWGEKKTGCVGWGDYKEAKKKRQTGNA